MSGRGGAAARAALVFGRIDARRPASWLGLATAAAAAGMLDGPTSAWWPALPIAAGGLAATAAIGGPPRDAPGLAAAWAAARAAWPLAGVAAAVAAGRAEPLAGAAAGCAIVATAAVVAISRERAVAAGEAASLALVAAGAAAAAALAVRTAWPAAAGAATAAAVAAWVLVAGRAAAGPWASLAAEPRGELPPAVRLVTFGPWGRLWLHAAMLSALAGMAGWLVLAPERRWCYAALAAGWFVAAAVPLATLGPGIVGASARRRLEATAARGPGWWRLPAPGRAEPAAAFATAATFAAILGWPPLVADLLAGGSAAGGNLLVAAGLAAAAAATAGVVAAVAHGGGSRETAQALALACAVACAVGAAKSGVAAAAPVSRVGLLLSDRPVPARLPRVYPVTEDPSRA